MSVMLNKMCVKKRIRKKQCASFLCHIIALIIVVWWLKGPSGVLLQIMGSDVYIQCFSPKRIVCVLEV